MDDTPLKVVQMSSGEVNGRRSSNGCSGINRRRGKIGYNWGVDRLWGTLCSNKYSTQTDEDRRLTDGGIFCAFLFNTGSNTDHDTGMAVEVFYRSHRLMGFTRSILLQTRQVNA
jgi:hypothetical protein